MTQLLEKTCEIARAAGAEILRVYNSSGTVSYKSDDSPLTEADQASHRLITSQLKQLDPAVPIVSEEAEWNAKAGSLNGRFWLVDPLDGTKEFLKRTGDFTVNIALVENDRPVLGVIYVPARDWLYFAPAQGPGAWKLTGAEPPQEISVRRADSGSLCVVASKDHAGAQVDRMLARIPNAALTSMGSSLKFCLLAEGKADIYPRFVPTMEWDTAAADCILEAAGGVVCDLDGARLRYQKPGWKNGPIISVADRSLNWKPWLP